MQSEMDGHFARLLAGILAAFKQAIPRSLHSVNQPAIIIAKGRALDIQRDVALMSHASILLHFFSWQLAACRLQSTSLCKRARALSISVSLVLDGLRLGDQKISGCKYRLGIVLGLILF